MQPVKSLFLTGKSSGRLGTPPSSSGPVKSSDLQRAQIMHQFGSDDPDRLIPRLFCLKLSVTPR